MRAVVQAADVQDRDGGVLLMGALFGLYPFLLKLYADSGYQGAKFRDGLARACAQVNVEIVKRFRPPQVRRPAQTLDRRTHHRLAQPMPPTGQRLAMSQPLWSCVPEMGVRPPHAAKALSEDKLHFSSNLASNTCAIATTRSRHARGEPLHRAEYLRRAAVVASPGRSHRTRRRDAGAQAVHPPFASTETLRPQPEWTRIHAELRRPGVTLLLLWEEYRAGQPEGYGYSRFCDLYAAWRGRLSPTMRQTHPPGERLFVDYAGQTVPVIDAPTGAARPAQIFVAALGASNFTYAEARWTQSLPDWIGCHVNTLPTSAVSRGRSSATTSRPASPLHPAMSPDQPHLSGHGQPLRHGHPADPRSSPRDKAKVEVAVQLVQRWVLARLRHRRFFSLAELNAAIRELIAELNTARCAISAPAAGTVRGSRAGRSAALPSEPYVYAEWRRCRAGLDYHVEVHGHFYSVPYRLMRETIEARITDQTIELFHAGVRIAAHLRNPRQHRHTTIPEHMPSAHRRYADWTPLAAARGRRDRPGTIALVERILSTKPHPEQGFRACLGILRLVRGYGPERLEAACQRGLDIGARSYGSVQSILRNGLDRAYRPEPVPDELPVQHGNIRGSRYYH